MSSGANEIHSFFGLKTVHDELILYNINVRDLLTIQDPTDDTRRWDSPSFKEMHDKFGSWASETNDPCDAEENSYDGMVLLTGVTFPKGQICAHFFL